MVAGVTTFEFEKNVLHYYTISMIYDIFYLDTRPTIYQSTFRHSRILNDNNMLINRVVTSVTKRCNERNTFCYARYTLIMMSVL